MLIDTANLADDLIAAYNSAKTLPPITVRVPGFGVGDGYGVLAAIEKRRRRQGWQDVGRKIGFTNRTIWARYGVWEPIWAHMWAHTVHVALDGRAHLNLAQFVQPRIEPEVVFRLKAPVPPTDDPSLALACVEWIAPGFEIVQSRLPRLEIRSTRLRRRLRVAWRAHRRVAGAGDGSKPRPIVGPACDIRADTQAGRRGHRYGAWSERPGRTAGRARAPRSRCRGTAAVRAPCGR